MTQEDSTTTEKTMRKKSKSEPVRQAVQGFACQCHACLSPDTASPYRTDHFCARCGHCYIYIGDGATSGCTKCGATGQWTDAKPALPQPPLRLFEVRLSRRLTQTKAMACSARTSFEAVTIALETADRGTWVSGEPDAPYYEAHAEVAC